jgi:polysaccharide export outer membrane protein
MTVLDALAEAGGFRDFANVQKIYLLRLMPDGSRKRLSFDYKAAVNGKNSYHDIELQSGDTLVVP